ncbi:ATP-binding protein [Piscinibacter sp. HJYY11]|uniref:ATP-binding protein n=1 Tax=Piscinibacter sp. HJYY11 TaxID=2801333 RepID=UPI00191DCD03|nr:ATP-binding protein [Piscinibacter sp. HJYY11]MBL0730038.1 HAMP domain-containing protein [Piscinibacter sp. HJYY11]
MRRWSLHARILAVLLTGLLLAHGLTFAWVLLERSMVMRGMMVSYLASDIASSVAVLERLPADERGQWLQRLSRRNYRLTFEASASAAAPASSALAQSVARELSQALGPSRPLTVVEGNTPGAALRVLLPLAGGPPLVIELDEPRLRISPWAWAALALQLALLAGLSVWAVRTATRPLQKLADAADQLQPEQPATPLAEDGPSEVARAAAAFNRMQQRIEAHLQERMHILAAVSHDLQTPITRMRLRADLQADAALRNKLHADLAEMQSMVEEGIAYARSAQAAHEAPQRTDLQALVQSIVLDYADAGRPVALLAAAPLHAPTRPQALRRLLCNLIDNALKFAGSAEVQLTAQADGWTLQVLDRGPGIPADQLERVMQPFVRLEDSRHRSTGGTGLGLAIAHQLAQGLGGRLVLGPRDGGGLDARFDSRA